MKIRVEVEVAPNEVPLATELLAVLRQLTDHVSVKHTDGSAATTRAASAGGEAPAAAAATPLPHAQSAPQLPSAATAPATPASSTGGSAAGAVAGPPAIPFPAGTSPQQQMHTLIAQAEFAENVEPLARQLEALVSDPALGGPAALFPQFVEIWSGIALDPQLAVQERSALPFVLLLQPMGQRFREQFRDRIMRDLLKHLTALRPVSANRSEYYMHAEAFAALVSIEIVPLEGAIQTMCTLVKNEQKRGAAVTMLGKTVEMAGHLILEKVSQPIQEMMRTCVLSITDAEFHYDVEYIAGTMGWAAGTAVAAPPAVLALTPHHSIVGGPSDGHTEMVFALALDAAHQQLASGGKDTYLQAYSSEGRHIQKLELGSQYISSMDFHPALNMLICSCLNPAANQGLRLAGYKSMQPQGFAFMGHVQRDDMVAVATVRALPDTTGFLTGETVLVNKQPQPMIRYWDMAAASSFEALAPTQSFTGHLQIPTALRGVAGQQNLFVSGDKAGSLLLWDVRSPQQAGAFGVPGANGVPMAHGSMITSLESAGPLIISGSTDKTVALWDLRQLGTAPLSSVTHQGMAVLKLALNASCNVVAVSAVHSLHLLDISNPAAPVLTPPIVAAWPDGRKRGTYHDIKWGADGGWLYAAGKDKCVDIYTLG